MLGGIHLGDAADLCMAATPSVCLPKMWWFLPGKVGLPFLTAMTKESTNIITLQYFTCTFESYCRNGDLVMLHLINLPLCFRPRFFEDSLALLAGFCKLIFSNGLDYASTSAVAPDHISSWHFLSSLDSLPDGHLPPLGLTSPQLAQVLVNYQACFKQIFANGTTSRSHRLMHPQ